MDFKIGPDNRISILDELGVESDAKSFCGRCGEWVESGYDVA